MKTWIIIFAVLSILCTLAIGYFEWKDKKGLVFSFVILSAFLSITTLILQQLQQNRDSDEITRINNELISKTSEAVDYASGGSDNKPLIQFNFERQSDSSYQCVIQAYNFGKYPISNLFYELSDGYSYQVEFMKEHRLKTLKNLGEAKILELNKYQGDHSELVDIHGSLANLPSKTGMRIHMSRIAPGLPAVMFTIKLLWNNQNYTAIYQFYRETEEQNFKILDIRIIDANGKAVADLAEFFPLVPKEYWTGFSTKLDTVPKTYQIKGF